MVARRSASEEESCSVTEAKPYIAYGDFPSLTPFSEQAIKNAVHRRELKEGVHFFRRGRRVIFKWSAVEAWIEGRVAETSEEPVDLAPVRTRRVHES